MQLKFYLKDPTSKAETTIFISIAYQSNRVKYYTDLKINPKFWDLKNQNVKAGMVGAPEYNQQLNTFKGKIQKCFVGYTNDNGHNPNPENLKKLLFKVFKGEVLSTKEDKLKTFWGFFTDFINGSTNGTRKGSNGNNISEGTIKNYKTLRNHLQAFEQTKRKTLDFAALDLEFYADFVTFLQTDLKLSKNSISKHIRTLKTVLRESFEKEYHTNQKFSSKRFAAPSELTTAVYLNEDELKQLYELDLTGLPRLQRVRDLFLIGCYTGLRFGDLGQVKADNIITDPKTPGDLYLRINQSKTGKPVTIPIDARVLNILKQYNQQLPPSISNQKTNAFLKEIGKMLPALMEKVGTECTKGGVKVIGNVPKYELISTHTARRSFATNAYLAGHQTINIMAVTGHHTEKSFNRYIRVTDMEKARLFKLHSDKRVTNMKAV